MAWVGQIVSQGLGQSVGQRDGSKVALRKCRSSWSLTLTMTQGRRRSLPREDARNLAASMPCFVRGVSDGEMAST